MRNYTIFLIEPEVANDYYGKEMLLFTLFSEFHRTASSNNSVVKKQVEYITQELPLFHLHHQLHKNLKQCNGFSITKKGFEIKCTSRGGQSIAKLSIYERCIYVYSQGNFEAETTFFEALRKIESYFFAMDFNRDHYGWLNPIKQRKYV